MPLLEYASMDFHDTWNNDHQVGGQEGYSGLWGQKSSKGHLGSLLKDDQNAASST